MTVSTERTRTTEEVARRWFDALTSGDIETALDCLHPDVEWINYTPVPGFNTDMDWIGTYHGRQAVLDSFRTFTNRVDVRSERLVRLIAQDDQAAGVVHEESVVKETGMAFTIEFVQWLTVADSRIVRWKSYTDPSQIIRALRGETGGGERA
ncbi:nuclear transport factor 2 family protein [Salinactinospora qingdaonensis]|uniref:SnoaL-like domain-containing protein n=1 Tax=Salinactinospora qingdaonensis TaxID=702744 RepID=A0ABP7FHP3_9ACTN